MSEFECPRCGHCCSQSVHSCSNECDRPACVNVRKAVEREREACLQQIGILVEAEREACARMAEAFHQHGYDFTGDLELHEAIRARGEK